MITKVKATNPLEITLISILRDEPDSQKRQKLNAFIKVVQEYINDARDVQLYGLKEK
jgi:hypothetical protein